MRYKTLIRFAAFCLLGLLSGNYGGAASLMLDFGPTAVQPADATKSPAHAAGAVPATEITWSTGIIADTASGLVYSDGTPATGVSIDIGRSVENADTIQFALNDFRNAALGGAYSSGIYAGSSPVKDGIFGMTGATSANNVAVGVRIDGLPAGTYTIYIHGRNTSSSDLLGATPERFYAATGPSADSYSFSTADLNTLLANSAPANTTNFVLANNYNTITIAVAAGQSLFIAAEGTSSVERRGFINTLQLTPASAADLAAKITAQPPATQTALEGTAWIAINAQAQGQEPLYRRWRFEGQDIPEATGNTLVLSNISRSMAGNYSLYASNAYGTAVSSNCLLTVTPVLNTPQMTNIWNLYANERSYIAATNSNERGLAYNPITTNLLLVSRTPAEQVVVLDARTGAEKHFLGVGGVYGTVPGQTLGLSMIGVADDGVVFAANLTVNAAGTYPLFIYRWNNDSPGVDPGIAFAGDPGWFTISGLRYGDNMVVRGAGATTQILMASGAGTNVVLFRTADGTDFQYGIPPAMISISGVPSGFAQLGLGFGPGTNTLWGKTAGGQLYLVQFDADAGTGTVLHAYSPAAVPGSVRGIAADPSGKWLAGVCLQAPDSVCLYDVSDLDRGPVLADEELYALDNANTVLNGTAWSAFGGDFLFALDSNNGIKAFLIDSNYAATAPIITQQPANQAAVQSAPAVSFVCQALGAEPMHYQWRFNGANLPNSNTNVLTLSNITLDMAGVYSVVVTNAYGSTLSSNALLTVRPIHNTAQMSNMWSLLPESRPYLGTNSTERGLAYNAVRNNLLLVSRSPAESVVVLDALTGQEKHFLDVTGIPGSIPNVSLGLNQMGVADDGAVFGGSVTVVGSTTYFYLYRWPDDSAGVPPSVAYGANPGEGVEPGLRWGDVMAVRGAGPATQVLLAPTTGTNVVLLRTTDGFDFQYGAPPTVIAVSGVPSGFAALGLAFGSGNTFWAKAPNSALYHVQFDLTSNTGTVLQAYAGPASLLPMRGIAVDPLQRWLAGVVLDTPDNVHFYDISNPAIDPILRDQELFAVDYPNGVAGGTGATAFGGNYLFALDTNNGLKAFLIDPNYVSQVPAFRISNVSRNGTDTVLTWESVPGYTYQVQYRSSATTGQWQNAGAPIQASGGSSTFTHTVTNAEALFYRIEVK